jgi:hypothetical protein
VTYVTVFDIIERIVELGKKIKMTTKTLIQSIGSAEKIISADVSSQPADYNRQIFAIVLSGLNVERIEFSREPPMDSDFFNNLNQSSTYDVATRKTVLSVNGRLKDVESVYAPMLVEFMPLEEKFKFAKNLDIGALVLINFMDAESVITKGVVFGPTTPQISSIDREFPTILKQISVAEQFNC